MAIDTRYSLLSLLARRREKFTDWLERANVASYEELCKKTDALGAQPVPHAEYAAAANELKAKRSAAKKLDRAQKSGEENDNAGTRSKKSSSVIQDSRQARKARNSSSGSRSTPEPSDD